MPPKKKATKKPPIYPAQDAVKEQEVQDLLDDHMQHVADWGYGFEDAATEMAEADDDLPIAKGIKGWTAQDEYLNYTTAERQRIEELDQNIQDAFDGLGPHGAAMKKAAKTEDLETLIKKYSSLLAADATRNTVGKALGGKIVEMINTEPGVYDYIKENVDKSFPEWEKNWKELNKQLKAHSERQNELNGSNIELNNKY
jgi:hypothetical protein